MLNNHTAMAHPRALHRSLSSLTSRGLQPHHVAHALQFWHHLCADHSPPEPSIEGTSEHITFAWRDDTVYLDVQVTPDGRFEWFADSEETWLGGTDDEPTEALPAEFYTLLDSMGA